MTQLHFPSAFRKLFLAVALVAVYATSIQAQTVVTYDTVGLGKTFTVPPGVTSIRVKAWGAGGGAYVPDTNIGGGGGFAAATLAVTPGEVLTVDIGGGGTTAGGVNGGGASAGGAGGGGMTDIKRNSTYLVIAGGGGGAGNGTGGSGGGTAGTAATVCDVPTQGGSQSAGGLPQGPATAGTQYQGGTGPQGGGGGGYYGGGGGGVGCGGGGGSGYVTGTCTQLITAPSGGYPYVGGVPADTANAYYNGTAGRGVFGSSGKPGLLVIIYGWPTVSAPTITGNFSPCIGDTVTYTTEPGMVNYIWNVYGGTIVAGGNTVNYSVRVKWTSAGSITVSYTDCGTPTTTTTKTITQGGGGVGVITGSNDTICSGSTVQLKVSGNPANVQWQSATIGYGFTNINGATDSTYTATPGQTTDYRVVVGSGACSDSSASFKVTVNFTPEVPEITGDDVTSFCPGDSIQLCTDGISAQYAWSNGASTSCIYVKQTGDYSVTVSGIGGCTAVSGTTHIQVYPAPAVSVTVHTDSLFAYSPSATYQWYMNGSPIDGATDSIYVAKQDGSYAVDIADGNGCHAISDYAEVHVNAIVEISGANLSIYPNPAGDKLFVTTSSATGTVQIHNVLGQLVFTQQLATAKTEMDVSKLQPGIYSLTLGSKQGIVASKFIKK